jgi:hypothetical protein
MAQVVSEAIDEIEYDAGTSRLLVRFAHGGWYQYLACRSRSTKISSPPILTGASFTSKSVTAFRSAEVDDGHLNPIFDAHRLCA